MSGKQPLAILLLGEACSGKTALLTRLERDTFAPQYRPSIGADFTSKELDVGSRTELVRVWDTPGKVRFPSCFGWQYWREAKCCVLVYDITSRDSFRRVESVREEFLCEATPLGEEFFPFVLVGNKADREGERQVGWSEAQTWARTNGDMPHFQTSASDGTNVSALFHEAARLAFRRLKYVSGL